MTRLQRRAAALRRENGFTIIEVMVAALLIVTAVLALLAAFDAMAKGALTAQRHQQALAYGQRQLERLRTLEYTTQLGLTAMPTASASDGNPASQPSNNPADPNFYVTGTGTATSLKIMARYTDKTSGLQPGVSPNPELIVGPGEAKLTDPSVDPGPQTFNVNGLTGKIYRYVTWRAEHCPSATTSQISTPCTGKDSKRITIAIVPDRLVNGAGPSKPIWLSTVVADPNATPTGVSPPRPASNDTTVTAQTFFLYDTRCSSAARQPIAASHPTHDTSAMSTSGALTTCGASTQSIPDLMDKDVTPGLATDPVFDYSNEVPRPAVAGLTDRAGVALARGSGCPTSYDSSSASSQASTVHTWATVPIPAGGFTIPSGARAALSFWTQTSDGTAGRAALCVTVRDAQTRAVLGSYTYDQQQWPTQPTQLSFAWDLSPTTLPAGDRLLLTLSLGGSSTKDIVLLYDHPSYQSSLAVATSTPLP